MKNTERVANHSEVGQAEQPSSQFSDSVTQTTEDDELDDKLQSNQSPESEGNSFFDQQSSISTEEVVEPDSQKMLRRFVRFEQRESVALMILAGLAVFYTLYLTRAIALPITFALLLALTLRPIVRILRKRRVPNTVGALIVVFGLVLLSVIPFARVLEPARQWAATAPENIKLLKEKLEPIQEKFGGISESSEVIKDVSEADGTIEPISVQIKQSSLSSNMAIMSTTGNVFGSIALVLSLTFFFLAYGDELTNSVLHLLSTYFREEKSCRSDPRC